MLGLDKEVELRSLVQLAREETRLGWCAERFSQNSLLELLHTMFETKRHIPMMK
jgi:hypothetical protein